MANRLPELTADQVDALRRYQQKHGRNWKAVLNGAWMGQAPYDDAGTLRQLRNSHGPSWLVGYKLPKEAPALAAATEPTPAGLQYVVPGCEKDRTRGPAQMDFF